MLEGNRIDNVKGFYKNVVGGRAGVTEYYMYDATNIRLRELSVELPTANRMDGENQSPKAATVLLGTQLCSSSIKRRLLTLIWYYLQVMITKELKFKVCLPHVVWDFL